MKARISIRHAVFGNAGTYISFRVGEKDAQLLAQEYGSRYIPDQFSSLGNFEVLAKLLSGGRHMEPFSATTMPPLQLPGGRLGAVIRRSRDRYASRRKDVEGKINRWMRLN